MKTSANVQTVDLADGRRVCLSYGVIVAAFIPRGWDGDMTGPAIDNQQARTICGYVRTDARYSVTTSKHMNQFAGKDAPTVPHADLLKLCAPVASRL